jgi:hypothetical protein
MNFANEFSRCGYGLPYDITLRNNTLCKNTLRKNTLVVALTNFD